MVNGGYCQRKAVILLAMLVIAESRRVQQYGHLKTESDLNSGASASRVGEARANSSARNSELKATLAEPTTEIDFLLTQMVGNSKLQEEIRTLAGEVRAMMADPLLQEQTTLVAEQLEKMKVDATFQKQASQFREQANEVATQMMQSMMTDPRLPGDATEAIMSNPRFHLHARSVSEQLEAMNANQNFQDQATPISQLMEMLMADPNFQRHARRIAAHAEAIRAYLISLKTDGGPTQDLYSLAEIDRSSSGISFLPLSLSARRPAAVGLRSAASQALQENIHAWDPQAVGMPRGPRHLAGRTPRPRAPQGAVMFAGGKSKGIDMSLPLCLALLSSHSEAAHALGLSAAMSQMSNTVDGVAPTTMVEYQSTVSVLDAIGTALAANAGDFGGNTIPIIGIGVLAATIAILAGPVED